MKKVFLILIATSFMSVSYADAIRCGTALASTGDSKAAVIDKCGQPISDEIVSIRNGTIISELVYEVNGNKKILVFRGNVLESVKDI